MHPKAQSLALLPGVQDEIKREPARLVPTGFPKNGDIMAPRQHVCGISLHPSPPLPRLRLGRPPPQESSTPYGFLSSADLAVSPSRIMKRHIS